MSVGRGVWFKKDTVDDCLRLDMMALAREVDLETLGYTTRTWTSYSGRVSRISIMVHPPKRLRFLYDVTDKNGHKTRYDYYNWLETTECNYGGKRWWFRCNDCDRRCRMLYKPYYATEFKCRLCYNLTYQSQQEGVTKAGALIKVLLELPELQHRLYRTRSAKERKRIMKKAARICRSVEWL